MSCYWRLFLYFTILIVVSHTKQTHASVRLWKDDCQTFFIYMSHIFFCALQDIIITTLYFIVIKYRVIASFLSGIPWNLMHLFVKLSLTFNSGNRGKNWRLYEIFLLKEISNLLFLSNSDFFFSLAGGGHIR